MRGRPERVAFVVSEAKVHEHKGDAQLEQALIELEAPPERERSSQASRVAIDAAEIRRCFCLRFSRAVTERRAPKLLHVGRRIAAIQGRRVGEWLRQHRLA